MTTHTGSDPLLARLERVRARLAEKEIDALLLTDAHNIAYVSGFTGSTSYALVTPHESVLITDPRYTLRARAECPYFTLAIAAGSGGYLETLKEVIAGHSDIKRLGFESDHVTVAQWEKFKSLCGESVSLISTDSLVEDLRLIKDETEIAEIRHAIKIAEIAFQSISDHIRAGQTEREIAIALEFAMRYAGADGESFETIVASGEQGARPHHTPNDRTLAVGDLVTIDWGALVNGYCSDITRTVGIGQSDDFTDQQYDIYTIVLQAQRAAIAAIAPGKTGREIDSVAREYIASRGYGDAFSHSLGHSLGRDVHDGPGFSARADKLILQPGMVMTVEPGIYLAEWGGVRIEEDVLVTETGCDILTNLPNSFQTFVAR